MLVFKRFALLFFALTAMVAKATVWTVNTLPDPKSAPSRTSISDPDNLIDGSTEALINAITWDIEQKAQVQFGIVIVNSIGSEVPKTFASNLFNYWGIGKSGKDNGLLLVVVLDQKRWEFETGYGLEGDLTDYECKQLGTYYLVPYFKQGDFQGGIYNVVKAIRVKLFSKFNIPVGDSLERPTLASTISYSDNYSNTSADPYEYRRSNIFIFMLGIIIPYLLVMAIWYYQAFWSRRYTIRTRDKYGARKPSHFLFIPVALLPVATMVYIYNDMEWWDSMPLLSFGSIYASLMLLILGYRVRLNRGIFRKSPRNFYLVYSNLRTSHSMWTLLFPIFFPVAGIPYLVWYYSKCRQLRRTSRPCKKCNANMTYRNNVVDEVNDDKYLDKGQIKEEHLKSRDWDVWLCHSCNNTHVLGYKAYYTSYGECPACKCIAELNEGSVTITPATYSSSGQGKTTYRCKNCGKCREVYYTIPMKTESSSSSSSGGSSWSSSGGGGGSSWGGGRSGGGGAGGSW